MVPLEKYESNLFLISEAAERSRVQLGYLYCPSMSVETKQNRLLNTKWKSRSVILFYFILFFFFFFGGGGGGGGG